MPEPLRTMTPDEGVRPMMTSATKPRPENIGVAAKLRDFADLLDSQGADGFRARAYRSAADVVAKLERPLGEILAKDGRDGLVALPAIGTGIAGAIAEIIATGRWSQLERLRGEMEPEALFRSIPGIGPQYAHRLAEDAQFESLEDLEAALHSGELRIKGIGHRRKEMLAATLAERLGRVRLRTTHQPQPLPPVSMLLDVDRMYREKAAAGALRKIAPRRFNPKGEAWLPVLHARHDNWHFTAFFSNTRLAHELAKTRDWVVIYFQAEGQPEGRCTVVTETRGPMAGKRVVRGREDEKQLKEPA
ncbi:nucleotidyltransferase family protein [Mesorhizobium tianshanense]|uniref:Helix-hairpin-helix DNA-binding protein n=1 Tax=Mesorhizobium tianshanense TaxID=39844 RepID=A0A562NPJ0_9HYPH|nr:helix-hairpin-helix domain-containing protein [Mesorhizobium tianshanense]TWI34088.1 helix-hairpin-helix DNA-binding protein [Mesorhizobium tianshanense]